MSQIDEGAELSLGLKLEMLIERLGDRQEETIDECADNFIKAYRSLRPKDYPDIVNDLDGSYTHSETFLAWAFGKDPSVVAPLVTRHDVGTINPLCSAPVTTFGTGFGVPAPVTLTAPPALCFVTPKVLGISFQINSRAFS